MGEDADSDSSSDEDNQEYDEEEEQTFQAPHGNPFFFTFLTVFIGQR